MKLTRFLLTRILLCAAPLALLTSCSGCDQSPNAQSPNADSSTTESARALAKPNEHGHAATLAKLDKAINAAEVRARQKPNQWLVRQQLASTLMERASLSGRFEDYLRVQRVLDEAFDIAPEGAGPVLVAARFNYSIHRLDKVDDYLDIINHQAIISGETKLGGNLLLAQLAFHRGDYETALDGFQALAKANPEELALYYFATGDTAQAEALFQQALEKSKEKNHRGRAWLNLQLGIVAMETGRYPLAHERMFAADAEFPGYWLIQEHIAEVYTLMGKDREAVEIYEKVVKDTELPQYLDALAGCYVRMGRQDEAATLIARARVLWDEQLEALPEAATGHAIEHFLEYGPPERALELAKKNFAIRPGGEAQVLLAKAYLASKQPKEALEILEKTLKTPYSTADLHDTARETYVALGQSVLADEQRTKCLALNPQFDHGT